MTNEEITLLQELKAKQKAENLEMADMLIFAADTVEHYQRAGQDPVKELRELAGLIYKAHGAIDFDKEDH